MKRLLFIVVVSAVGIPAWTRGVVLLLVEDAGGRFLPMVPERAHATLIAPGVALVRGAYQAAAKTHARCSGSTRGSGTLSASSSRSLVAGLILHDVAVPPAKLATGRSGSTPTDLSLSVVGGDLGAVLQVQLFQDVVYVVLDGAD